MAKHSLIVDVLIRTCHKASSVILRDLHEIQHLSRSQHGRSDIAKNTSLTAERIIATELCKARPYYHFLMSKSGYIATTDLGSADAARADHVLYRWLVNPITNYDNFVHANGNFAISIALEKLDISKVSNISDYVSDPQTEGETVISIVHVPSLKESYWAEKGVGAYFIDTFSEQFALKGTMCNDFHESMLAMSVDGRESSEFYNQVLSDMLKDNNIKLRCTGDPTVDIMSLSRGTIDAVIFENMPHFEQKAAKLIAKESSIAIVEASKIDEAGENAVITAMAPRKMLREFASRYGASFIL